MLFGVKVTDTQGTFFINTKLAQNLLPKLTATGFFFQTQIVVYAVRFGYSYVEIPVVYYSGKRLSKVKISDAFGMLSQLFVEYARNSRIKNET